MIVETTKYVIISKSRPIAFYQIGGNPVDEFDDADLLELDLAKDELSKYDEPDNYEMLPVKVLCEI